MPSYMQYKVQTADFHNKTPQHHNVRRRATDTSEVGQKFWFHVFGQTEVIFDVRLNHTMRRNRTLTPPLTGPG